MKPIRFRQILFSLAVLISVNTFAQKKLPQLGKNPVAEVVKAMTFQEKARMLVGFGFKVEGVPANFLPPTDPADDSIKVKVPGTSGRMHGVNRLGIPILTLADGPAGVHIWGFGETGFTPNATAIPNASLLSSTWDTALVKKVGEAFGSEAKGYGIDIVLAPAMNIQRNPLNGRNFEYYSEDPVLSGNISAAMVNGVQSEGVGVSVKHFVANNTETNRSKLNTVVSQRALREIYLRGFEIAIKKSNPWTIMSSYNKVNGVYTSESKDLLTTILRNEWGFNGFVMSDWFGGQDAVAQINAGNNLLMPGNFNQTNAIINAVQHDSISMKMVDKSVEQILNIIMLSPTFKNYQYNNKPNLAADAIVSRTAAAEGMVLLKNDDNALPLKSGARVALYGNSSYDIIAGGTGSGDVQRAYTISLIDGLTNSGFKTEESVTNLYRQYIQLEKAKQPKPSLATILNPPPPPKEMNLSDSLYSASANDADIAILSIGRNAGEGKDRKAENDFNLTDAEKNTIQKLSSALHAQHKKLVVVINSGGVIETASWRDYADAILLAWQPGMEGGNAMADVLSGKVNPSGKLPETFPVAYTDVSTAKNFPGKELAIKDVAPQTLMDNAKPSEITYEEGIYVGYRYFNTFNVKSAYAFGYGLSYTNFSYGNLKLNSSNFNNQITVTFTITNTGKVAGKEVAEIYLTAPSGKLDKPAEELKAFAKTRLLKPGQSQTLTFTLHAKDLASFNTSQSAWIADAGIYTVKVGASSEDIKLSKTFSLSKNIVAEKVNNVLAPQVTIDELKK
jgi:beta-glucosidase